MSRLDLVLEQIVEVRKYTLHLLETIGPEDWFRMPPAGVSHIAWQVGHIAFAQYRLALDRVRGTKPEDEKLISESFLALFGRDSTPDPDATKYPSAQEIRAVLDRVHEQAMLELKTLTEADLDQPTLKPHKLFTTKLGALLWCPRHEMLHAGQIGLLRRQLGHQYLW